MVNDRQSAPHHGDRETEEGFAGWPPHRTGSGRLNRGSGQRGGGQRSERREPREGEAAAAAGGGEGPSHSERSRGRRGGRGGRGNMQLGGSGSDRKSKVKLLSQHSVACFKILFRTCDL